MTAPVRPKKQLGQHFLHDRKVAERIASQISPLTGEHILEIGPGTGALTVFLAEKYPTDLTLVEIDPEAQAYLARQFPNVPLIGSDIFTYDLPNQPYVFISNLPYNISSPVLFYVLKYREIIRQTVFMVQKEVAQRICASEGNKTYGILSVLLGYYYRREYLFTVGKGAFTPPPKVESAVFRLERLPESERPLSLEVLAPIVKTAFGQRRKTLANALKSMNLTIPEAWQSLRAEQLSIKQFAELAEMNHFTR